MTDEQTIKSLKEQLAKAQEMLFQAKSENAVLHARLEEMYYEMEELRHGQK